MENPAKPARVHLLDEWRGLTILLMIFYHASYDIVYLFGVDMPWFRSPLGDGLQKFIATSFIFIAGISSRYSRGNIKRGLITFGLGVAVSIVTMVAMPGQMIWFGVLHFLGSAMMIFGLTRNALDKLPPLPGFALSFLLYAFFYRLPYGTVGFFNLIRIPLPTGLYSIRWLLPLGFSGAGSDYFPLLPWLLLFLCGTYAGVWFREGKMPAFFYRPHLPALSAIGKRSIVIYMLHQPLIYALLWIFFSVFR